MKLAEVVEVKKLGQPGTTQLEHRCVQPILGFTSIVNLMIMSTSTMVYYYQINCLVARLAGSEEVGWVEKLRG